MRSSTYISPSELNLEYIGGGDDPDMWGRVEVTPRLGSLRDDVLSVMYVRDKGDEDELAIREIKSDDLLGAEISGYALLFLRDLRDCPNRVEAETESATTYMISGLSAGEWTASVGDSSVSFTVTEAERFARIDLPAGKLTLTKA